MAAAIVVCTSCDDASTVLASVPDPSSPKEAPSLHVGSDTLVPVFADSTLRLRFDPRTKASYSVLTNGGTDVRLRVVDSSGRDTIAVDATPKAIGATLAWEADSHAPVWIELEGQNPSVHGAVEITLAITSGADEFEPDDTKETAQWILTDSTYQYHFMQAGETDWVKFQAKAGSSYKVVGNAGFDSLVPDSASPSRPELLFGEERGFKALKTGIVYLKMHGATASENRAYKVAVVADANSDAYEPDDKRESAKSIATDSTPQTRTMQLGEQDWIKFHVDSGKGYAIQSKVEDGTTMRLYAEGSSTAVDSGWSIDYKSNRTGTMFMAVVSRWRAHSGAYTISVKTDQRNDAFEPDDKRAQAKTIVVGASAQTRRMQPGERDWIRFEADSGKVYRIDAVMDIVSGYWAVYQDTATTPMLEFTEYRGTIKATKTGSIVLEHRAVSTRNLTRSTTGEYSVAVNLDATGMDRYEPDDSVSHSNLLVVDSAAQSHTLPIGDKDWFAFQADSGAGYLVAVDGLRELDIKFPMDTAGRFSMVENEKSFFVAKRSGLVHVAVSGRYGFYTGAYTIAVVTKDRYEPDGTREAAQEIMVDSLAQVRTLEPGEHDWIRFKVQGGKPYYADVSTAYQTGLDMKYDLYLGNESTPVISSCMGCLDGHFVAKDDGYAYIDVYGENLTGRRGYTVRVNER